MHPAGPSSQVFRPAGTHVRTHARKLICTGEGGFCLTDDPVLADRLRQLRNLGRPPSGGEFGAGFGLNYKLPALAAALGRVQLSRLISRLARRRLILGELATLAGEIAGLEPFPIPPGTEPNGYAALFTAESDLANRIAHRSRAAGIESDVLRLQLPAPIPDAGARPLRADPAVPQRRTPHHDAADGSVS